MVCLLWLITVPIGILWLNATWILQKLIPEQEVAAMTGTYLRMLLLGAPGYAAFESGKRFMQAQGLFNSSMWVLLIGAPLNALLNWLFVWVCVLLITHFVLTLPNTNELQNGQKFQWGFIGAPIAVAITRNLLPPLLFLYAYFINGHQCWHPLTWKAFRNWGPMIRLSLPGLLMIEAEFFAVEILTLVASYFSATHLAAQSVVATVATISWSIPFSASIASGTRVSNLIGAMQSKSARLAIIISLNAACVAGILSAIILATLRNHIPKLFTHDPDVILLVSRVLPICAAYQPFESLAAICNGVLRGLGRQKVGAWVGLFCWYGIALPIGLGTGFGLHWELRGLMGGVGMGLCLIALIELWVIYRTDWEKIMDDAKKRNSQE